MQITSNDMFMSLAKNQKDTNPLQSTVIFKKYIGSLKWLNTAFNPEAFWKLKSELADLLGKPFWLLPTRPPPRPRVWVPAA